MPRLKSTPPIPSQIGVASKLLGENSLETWLNSKSKKTPASRAFLMLLPQEQRVHAAVAFVRKLHHVSEALSLPKLLCGCGPMALHPTRSKMEPHLARAFFLDLLLRVQSSLNSQEKSGMLTCMVLRLLGVRLLFHYDKMLRTSLFWQHSAGLVLTENSS